MLGIDEEVFVVNERYVFNTVTLASLIMGFSANCCASHPEQWFESSMVHYPRNAVPNCPSVRQFQRRRPRFVAGRVSTRPCFIDAGEIPCFVSDPQKIIFMAASDFLPRDWFESNPLDEAPSANSTQRRVRIERASRLNMLPKKHLRRIARCPVQTVPSGNFAGHFEQWVPGSYQVSGQPEKCERVSA